MAGSEAVFNIIQLGAQAGTAYAPGSAAAATVLFPIEAPVNFELDRASQYPRQDRGKNVRNHGGTGFSGVRGSAVTLPSQVRYEDVMDILEMCFAGGIVPSSLGGGLYSWVYPFETGAPTLVPRTIEGGSNDASQSQMRMTSCLVDQLTIGFPDIVAPGAFPWTLSAQVMGLDREISALTASGAGTNEIQHVDLTADAGTFTLSFLGQTTSPLAFDASTAAVQTALRALTTINGANVNVTGSAGAYVVTFVSSLGHQNVAMLVGNASGLTVTGDPGAVTVTENTAGVLPTGVGVRTGLQIAQGHLTQLFEGDTSTAFGSLSELAGHLKSYTATFNRQLARRAYGGTSDAPSRFGFKEPSNGTFEMKLGISATSKSDFHDVWGTSGASLGERRLRVMASGTSGRTFTLDQRAGIFAVPYDEVDGERVFKVSGEFADDSTLGAPAVATVVNGISAL